MYGKLIGPDSRVELSKIDSRAPNNVLEEDGKRAFAKLATELGALQEVLYAAGTQSLLVIFQGMDTSGKDGGIRDVFSEVNPLGCRVASFKVPTALELGHDFLWRVHQQTPEHGQIVVFNRSHYEDVLIVRVHELAAKDVWSRRYQTINQFEKLLTDSNTIVLKFFLHISKQEQEQRLLARETDPVKAWKLAVNDWLERERWADYQNAYEDAIGKCSTADAPWYVIPADQKWFRNLAISEVIVNRLRPFRPLWELKLKTESAAQLAALRDARLAGIIPTPSKRKSQQSI